MIFAGSTAAATEPHLGFDVVESRGRLAVSRVFPGTDASTNGLNVGDVLVDVGGVAIRTEGEFAAFVARRGVGDKVRVRVKDLQGVITKKLRVVDKHAMLEETARRADAAREAKKSRERLLRAQQAKLEAEGVVSITAGTVEDDAIGLPQIRLRTSNASEQWIDAVEIEVAMFDKFDRPATGLWGASHKNVFLYQNAIAPLGDATFSAKVPWHATVGKAEVTVVRYKVEGGASVTPPRPRTVVVKR